jgi:hypothetical protein
MSLSFHEPNARGDSEPPQLLLPSSAQVSGNSSWSAIDKSSGNGTSEKEDYDLERSRQSSTSTNPPEIPTSPWRPWICLLGGFLLMFNSWGVVNTFGTYQSYYRKHLLAGKPDTLITLIGATESFIVLVPSFLVGRVLDAGKQKYLSGLGFVLLTVGQFCLSISGGDGGYNHGNYGAIWTTQGLVVGLGMSCFFVSSSHGKCFLIINTRFIYLHLSQSLLLGFHYTVGDIESVKQSQSE